MEDKTQSRKWLLTINNPKEHDLSHEDIKIILSSIKNLDYWCMCDEIGKNNTYHTHLFIYRKNQMRFSQIKKAFPTAHIDYCRGTCAENRNYIRKEGDYANTDKAETNLKDTFEEMCEMPEEHQGRRNDLHTLYGLIKDGCSNYDILESNPEYMLQLDKIEQCRQIVKNEHYKNTFRELEVFYHFGKTGKGKTRYVMEKYGYENVCRVTDYQHPFDNYKGQDVIVFEEFRSSLKIQDMLNYLDGYPLDLPCRYQNKVACFTKVYILSNISLDEQYTDVQDKHKETWLAFLRRITSVKEYDDNGIINYENIDEYMNRWQTKWKPVPKETTPFDKPNQMTMDEMEMFADANN